MAIKVNGTTVINDSRALSNIASVDATTAASITAAGVGGGTLGNVFYIGDLEVNITDATYSGVQVGSTIFIGGDSGQVWKSTDGVNFSKTGLGNTYNFAIRGMAVNSANRIVTSSDNGRHAVSTNNAVSFTIYNSGAGDLIDVACDGTTFVYVEAYGGRIYSSTDGVTLTLRNSQNSNLFWKSVAYNGSNLWVAGGAEYNSSTGIYTPHIAYSSNGTSWTYITTGTVDQGDSQVTAIAYGNGYWVAGYSKGQILYSTNGTSWTLASTVPKEVLALGYIDGVWVGGCVNGQIITTEDPTTGWKAFVPNGITNNPQYVLPHTVGANTLLVGGSGGKLQYTV